jgi:hypothetical protein
MTEMTKRELTFTELLLLYLAIIGIITIELGLVLLL